MTPEDKLNQLFEAMRTEKTSVNLSEVMTWIETPVAVSVQQHTVKGSAGKTLIISATIATTVALGGLFFYLKNSSPASDEIVEHSPLMHSDDVNLNPVKPLNDFNDPKTLTVLPAEKQSADTAAETTPIPEMVSEVTPFQPEVVNRQYVSTVTKFSEAGSGKWTAVNDSLRVDTLFSGIKKLVLTGDITHQVKLSGTSGDNVLLDCYHKTSTKGVSITLKKAKSKAELSYRIKDSVLFLHFDNGNTSTKVVFVGSFRHEGYLNLSIPSGLEIDLNTSFGDLKLSNLNTGNSILKTNYGDITAENIRGMFELKTDYGDITMQKLDGRMSLKTDYGKIRLTELSAHTYTIKSGYGKIEVSESKGALNMSTSYGDIKIKSCEGILNLETDYGDISGTNIKALGPISLTTDIGDIDFQLNDDAEKFEFNLSSDLGKVSINKNNLKAAGSDNLKAGVGEIKFRAITGSGNINIR